MLVLASFFDDFRLCFSGLKNRVRFQLKLQRVMPYRVLNGHTAVSTDMDLRLFNALGTCPGYWLALQTQGGFKSDVQHMQTPSGQQMQTSPRHYQQLQLEDRVTMASLLQQNHSLRDIATVRNGVRSS